MTLAAAPPGLQPDEFNQIEETLAQSSRGRLFLAECARRTTEAERARILAEIDRLLAHERSETALSLPDNAADAAAGLLDLAWSLRGNGKVDDALCDSIEALARTLEGVNWVKFTPALEPRRPDRRLPADDPRLDRLSWLDDLPLADRLAIFA